jgi:pimeloyl-ACP methyl ester carboxylesterase
MLITSNTNETIGLIRYESFGFQGGSLEYFIGGSGGEPVVFIHGSMIANANAPLLKQPSLAKSYRLISYHRRGYAGSTFSERPLTISQQESECQALMSYLEVSSAHIVGHSHGGVIALQLALYYPACVYSLSLLELALVGYISQAVAIQKKFLPVIHMYKKGDEKGAIYQMLQIVSGKRYRSIIEKILPNSIEQAIIDADGLFKIDMHAMQSWRDKQGDVESIDKPILCSRI